MREHDEHSGGEHFVFVESNTTGTGRLAVERLLLEGHRVSFLTRSPEKYPFLDPRPGLRVEEVETNDTEAVAQRAGELVRDEGAGVIFTFSEFYVVTVAEVAARLGLRSLDPRAARICRDKNRLREVLAEAGRPGPWHRLVRSPTEAEVAADEVAYPCVGKPTGDSSSQGVRRLDGPAELLDHYRELATWTVNGRGQPSDGALLLEGLIDGDEVSVETLSLADGSIHIIGICRKHLSDPPGFVELGHDYPLNLPPATAAALTGEVRGALRAVGYDFGFAHTEVRLSAGGPVVVEINPRLAGGMIPELVRHAEGLDLLSVLLDLLRGRDVDLAARRKQAASIRFLIAPRAGRLQAIEGVSAARQLPLVREVTVTAAVGAEVVPAEHALHRLGFVITSGDDADTVAEAAAAAAARIRLVVADGGPA